MNTAKLFTNGKSQAVRLPKEYRFDCKEVCINKLDEAVILYPKDMAWKLFDKSLDKFSKDFMSKRSQPKKLDKRAKL